ncbi:MAG: protein translocase subunit SecD, partial [Patescibacteria group bacterium]
MKKRNTYIILMLVIVLAVFAGLFAYPNYFNTGVDNLNKNLHLKAPHFPARPFQLGLDLKGGTHLLYEADLAKVAGGDRSSSMQGLRDVIERRINMFGVKEPVVQVQEKGDTYRLVVELAGVNDPAQAIKMIGETPFLEFKEQRPQAETDQILAKQKE